ncbi:hypothetical protein [Micromonospora sp. CPCC 205561]|uniref:hypothetical protein n=1 Tax=Micromonospora sp. CPCC 205561 TaxID=3122407 RepID=UPI002FEF902D
MRESNDRIWGGLPEEARDRIDELICRRHTVRAIRLLWRDAGLDPAPSLHQATDVVEERRHRLTVQGRLDPEPPPAPMSRIVERVEAIAEPVVAVEALWDGDTARWGVSLVAVVRRPGRHHPRYDEEHLCFLDGRGAPPSVGAGPRTLAGAEAVQKGSELARALGVPFHFFRADDQDVDPPRWWDSDSHGSSAAGKCG